MHANARVFELALFHLEELHQSVEKQSGPHITQESLLDAFQDATKKFGVMYSESQVLDVFRELDINQDGIISTSE